jgi:uncharacterized membrane protein YvbJ
MKGICSKCGAVLSEEDKICPNCGTPVEAEKKEGTSSLEDTAEIALEDTQETEVVSDAEEEKVYVVEKKPSVISTIFFILLVICLLGAAAFGYCYFKHPDYLDTAFHYIGVETNFARDIEIEGSYGKAKESASPSIAASPSSSPSAQ